jgi:hypothetical protein
MDNQTFAQWLESSSGGEKYIYCVRHVLDCKTPPEILHDARLAREAFAGGKVELVQKRTDARDSPFEYIAIKRKDVRPRFVNGERWVPKIVGQNQRGHRF